MLPNVFVLMRILICRNNPEKLHISFYNWHFFPLLTFKFIDLEAFVTNFLMEAKITLWETREFSCGKIFTENPATLEKDGRTTELIYSKLFSRKKGQRLEAFFKKSRDLKTQFVKLLLTSCAPKIRH